VHFTLESWFGTDSEVQFTSDDSECTVLHQIKRGAIEEAKTLAPVLQSWLEL
jgi:hypothetical protein